MVPQATESAISDSVEHVELSEMGGILKGSDAFVQTLIDSGVEVCFGNPGTSEMHLVAALDRYPELRGVLCLFEGVATGAADGGSLFFRLRIVP